MTYTQESGFFDDAENTLNRAISIDRTNYNPLLICQEHLLWYLAWCYLCGASIKHSFLESVNFVMCQDDPNIESYLKKIKKDFGINVISPHKIGNGLGSSKNEDIILKEKLISDLKNNKFDSAIICTGDGNKKQGLSFPQLADNILNQNKEVVFVAFGISTSKTIKEKYNFFDLNNLQCLPKYGGIENLKLI